MIKQKTLLIISLCVIVGSCSLKRSTKQEFTYVLLEEYHYQEANIQPGTEVELLAFSGGKKESEGSVLYYQFIVLEKGTKDTLRILTPFISVDREAGVEIKTYATPLQYDPTKGITSAFYEPMDSSSNLLLQLENLVKDGEVDKSVDVQSLMGHVDKKQLVVINESLTEFSNPGYRTAIGILNFKEIPW